MICDTKMGVGRGGQGFVFGYDLISCTLLTLACPAISVLLAVVSLNMQQLFCS